MHKGRIEAFSDGAIAIIITIMVLEMKPPHDPSFAALSELTPVFLSYVLSYVYIAMYWNNHHHLFQAARQVNGRILWANMNLLFWLSLFPFTTAWMGENHFAALPVALYGVDLLLAGAAYYLLTQTLIAHHGTESVLATAIGRNFKGKASLVVYAVAIPLSLVNTIIASSLYALVAILWLIPDHRIEKTLET